MAATAKTFRVFVSSTFSDLKAERNALQERVFPELRRLAADHGSRFQAIDLRWGVSEEASLDQQAMNICLGEIARCQQKSPRPNFIVLLGNRYGWCPPPSQIPASRFREILQVIEKDDKALLDHWYSLDKNAVPAEYLLNARKKGGDYEKYDDWQLVEARLQSILADAVTKLKLPDHERLPYTASATEQEIDAGALRVDEASEHVYCFFREVKGLPADFSAEQFQQEMEIRLQEEYVAGLPDPAFEKYLVEIKRMDPTSTAKDFDEWFKSKHTNTPKGSPERDFVSQIWGWLVDFTGKDFQNLTDHDWTPDKAAHESQIELKERLRAKVSKDNVYEYNEKHIPVEWAGRGITTKHIDQLCDDVFTALSGIMLREIEKPQQVITPDDDKAQIQPGDALDDERSAQRTFAEGRRGYFIGRTIILGKIADYINSTEQRTLAIYGAGGTGKSALAAKAIQETQTNNRKSKIVYRFIGATPGSSDGRSLLYSLCQDVSRCYGASERDIPLDYRELVPEFGKRLALATPDRPLILFLDSLDQLSHQQGARSLTWLPNNLPEHVRVIVTTRKEEDTFDRLQAKKAILEELDGLSDEEGDQLLSDWLADAGRTRDTKRTLQDAQHKEILDKFIASEGAPLYLKLAFEEARLWPSGDGKPPESLELGIEGIIEHNMIDRLEDEGSHGKMLVSKVLGYLAASRYGLAEDEIIDLLSRDLEMYKWFFEKSYHLPADLLKWSLVFLDSEKPLEMKDDQKYTSDQERVAINFLKEIRNPPEEVTKFLAKVLPEPKGPKLPVVLWSRLFFDLEPYLSERDSEGSTLLTFYHRELGEVSKSVYLDDGNEQQYHEKLADYFRFKADPKGNGSWTGSYLHGLSELPYHLTRAARYDEVHQTLTDFTFLERKTAEVGVLEHKDEKGNPVKTYTGVLQLQDDFEGALDAMPGDGESGSGDRSPLIVTAVDSGAGLSVYCPVCNKTSPVSRELLDTEITCPQKGCDTRLKINLFVINRS